MVGNNICQTSESDGMPSSEPQESRQYAAPNTIKSLALRFRVCRNTMSAWLKNGSVRAKRFGTRWAVLIEDLPYSDESHHSAHW